MGRLERHDRRGRRCLYRFRVHEAGETERTVPGIAVVRTNESADVDVGDRPRIDATGTKLATRFAHVRARESGSVDDPACARPYYHGDDSLLLSADGAVVPATGERWRVVVFEAGTREATVWEYEAELVANSETQLRRELARDVSVLSAAEREHVEAAAEEGGTLVPPGRMASGEAPAFAGLLRTSGFRVLEDPGDAYGVLQSTYVTYDGRVYVVEFRYRSGERSRGNERPRASVG